MNLLSRKDRQSDPHVTIQPDDACRGPFKPGSRITGTVTLQSATQRHLNHAEATFFGHAETLLSRIGSAGSNAFPLGRTNFSTNETLKYRDDACLFRLTQQLSQTSLVEPNRPYSYKFEFTFPHTATLIGPSPYVGPTEFSGAYTSDRHLLPPSFERYFNSNHRAKVEYTVQATFHWTDTPNALTIQLPPLDFLPISRQPDPSTFIEFVRSPESLSNSALRGKKFFRRSSRDSVSFTSWGINIIMKASINSQVVKASCCRIHACVEVNTAPQDRDSIRTVSLRVTSLKLREVTTFRGRLYSGGRASDEYQETGDQTFALNAVPDHATVNAQSQKSEREDMIFFPATFEAMLPGAAQPSFRTFNINHSFYLKATVEAEIFGKKLEHGFTLDNLTLLP